MNFWDKKIHAVEFDSEHLDYIIVQFRANIPMFILVDILDVQGIIVQMDDYKNKVNKFDYQENSNDFVLPDTYRLIHFLILKYNESRYPTVIWKRHEDHINKEIVVNDRREMYQYIISNIPMGFQLQCLIQCSYRTLKEIYNTKIKSKHKFKEWEDFSRFIHKLPNYQLITN